jgi:hypothetical protein
MTDQAVHDRPIDAFTITEMRTFCDPPAEKVVHEGNRVLVLRDGFPLNPGHTLVVPRRHIRSWFEASPSERRELLAALDLARAEIETHHAPDGFNIYSPLGNHDPYLRSLRRDLGDAARGSPVPGGR